MKVPLGRPYWVLWTAGRARSRRSVRTRVNGVAAGILVGAMVISSVAIIAFGLFTVFVLVAIAAIVLGFGRTWWNVVSITLRQRVVPAELLGRVTAVYRMVAFCAAPLGAVGAGFLAHTTDLRTPYPLLGLLQLAATAVSAPLIRREVRASADPGSAG